MPSITIANAFINPELRAVATSLLTWSRLEPLPVTPDLAPSLAAPVADPLWLLARQWQFGEFQGEDAGSPISAALAGEVAALERFLPGPVDGNAAARAVDYSGDIPLEAAIEQEPALASHPRLAGETGQHFLRILAAEGAGDLANRYRQAYPLALTVRHREADRRGVAWQALLAGRALDGRALAADLRPLADANFVLGSLPAQPAVPANRRAAVRAAGGRWLKWLNDLIGQPEGLAPPAWNPARQEYAMALSAATSSGGVTLVADEYTDGRLDWYSFRIGQGPALGAPAAPRQPSELKLRARIPTAARYPGMPADRYWEFEDGNVFLGGLEAGPTDLARLLLAEFALIFGNDWFVVPVEMPVGSLFRVGRFAVRDTFGVESLVGPSRDAGTPLWTMFSLTPVAGAPAGLRDWFFLPPAIARRLEGDPVEEVALFRDEMANMAWGVERKVQGAAGEPYERRLEADRLPAQQTLGGDGVVEAELIYRLATPVPSNWIPFVAVPAAPNQPANAFAIKLERRVLQRTMTDGTRQDIHPAGLLLRADLTQPVATEPALRLEEEEVPRAGAVVRRTFQFARWVDGTRRLWLGRSKGQGKGEGRSDIGWDRGEQR